MQPLLLAVLLAPAAAPPPPWKLSAEDRKYLDGILSFLVDPTGAERVKAPLTERRMAEWGERKLETGTKMTYLWRFPAGGKVARKFAFLDDEGMRPKNDVRRVDFDEECRAALRNAELAESNGGRGRYLLADLQRGWDTPRDVPVVALAAWQHRLKNEEMASRLLASIRFRDLDVFMLRRDHLARPLFNRLKDHFRDGGDAEALVAGERLQRLYAVEAKEWGDAVGMVADLKRRQKAGTFGKIRPFPPEGFDRWTANRRIAHLVESLEDISTGSSESYGVRGRWPDPRFKALVEMGDAAVPALLDALEKDRRLTRHSCLERWNMRSGDAASVAEVCLVALFKILRNWEILNKGLEWGIRTTSDKERQAALVLLRAYWKEHGSKPFAERQMRHLNDAHAGPAVWREASLNLALLGCREEKLWDHYPPSGNSPAPREAFHQPCREALRADGVGADALRDGGALGGAGRWSERQ